MDKCRIKKQQRQRRKQHIRKKLFGTPECPRLSVFRSLRNLYVQVVDDVNGVTLASANTLGEAFEGVKNTCNRPAAEKVGEAVARKTMDLGIRRVQFDRNGYKYHGRIKALADAARKAGLLF